MGGAKAAVIADISRDSAEKTRRMLENLGYEIVHFADDGARAVAKCISERACVLVIDQVMPALDGAAAAAKIRRMRLARYPAVIVSTYPGMAVRGISGMCGVCAAEKPLTENALARAVSETSVENRRMPLVMQDFLDKILDRLGVPAHVGRDYLTDAVFLAHEDRFLISELTGKLYPMVARRYGTTPAGVERAMRHAIEAAWSVGNIDEQYSIFKGTIDAAKGKPTCGGMIAQLSEMLRMEDER